jgi:hypothetical protein
MQLAPSPSSLRTSFATFPPAHFRLHTPSSSAKLPVSSGQASVASWPKVKMMLPSHGLAMKIRPARQYAPPCSTTNLCVGHKSSITFGYHTILNTSQSPGTSDVRWVPSLPLPADVGLSAAGFSTDSTSSLIATQGRGGTDWREQRASVPQTRNQPELRVSTSLRESQLDWKSVGCW